MTVLSIISTGISILNKLLAWAEQNRWIDAGRAMQIRDNLEAANAFTKEAIAAGKAAHDAPIDADGDGIADDDGFRRD